MTCKKDVRNNTVPFCVAIIVQRRDLVAPFANVLSDNKKTNTNGSTGGRETVQLYTRAQVQHGQLHMQMLYYSGQVYWHPKSHLH